MTFDKLCVMVFTEITEGSNGIMYMKEMCTMESMITILVGFFFLILHFKGHRYIEKSEG